MGEKTLKCSNALCRNRDLQIIMMDPQLGLSSLHLANIKKPKKILTQFVEIACLKCEDQGPYFCMSLPQKGNVHL